MLHIMIVCGHDTLQTIAFANHKIRHHICLTWSSPGTDFLICTRGTSWSKTLPLCSFRYANTHLWEFTLPLRHQFCSLSSLSYITTAVESELLVHSLPVYNKLENKIDFCFAWSLAHWCLLQAYTFERERCMKASRGGIYELEICVRSTAVSAERFRCVFLHKWAVFGIAPHASKTCEGQRWKNMRPCW